MRATFLLSAVLAVGVPAQHSEPDAALARAIAVEEVEHDAHAAIDLYRDLATTTTDRSVRDAAWWRLGRALRELGRREEGDAALRKAAAGAGAYASKARALLAEQDPDSQRELEARIRAAIAGAIGTSARDDLVWIGAPAVPLVLKEVQREGLKRRALENLCYALLRIGGDDVVRWLHDVTENGDPSLRSSLLLAFDKAVVHNRAVVAELVALLRDPDPQIRERAVGKLWAQAPSDDVIRLTGDPDAEVRYAALKIVQEHWHELRHRGSERDSLQRLIPHLRKGLGDLDSHVGRKVLTVLQQDWALTHHAGRSLFLEALSLPAYRAVSGSWALPPLGADEHVTEVVAVARALGPVSINEVLGEARPTDRQNVLGRFVQGCLPSWNVEALDGVLELVSLGYAEVCNLDVFTRRVCTTPAQYAAVAEHLPQFAWPGEMVGWLVRSGAGPGVAPQLVALLDRIRGGAMGGDRAEHALDSLCRALGQLDQADVCDRLVELAKDPRYAKAAVEGLLLGSSQEFVAAQLEVMASQLPVSDAAVYRNKLFGRALELGVPADAAPSFARAYRLGVKLRPNHSGLVGLEWLLDPGATSPSVEAKITAACFATGSDSAWHDFANYLKRSPNVVPEVRDVAIANVAKGPRKIRYRLFEWLFRDGSAPGLDALARTWLREQDTYAQQLILLHLPLPHSSPELMAAIAEALSSDAPEVVRTALEALARSGQKRWVPAVAERLSHASQNVRCEAIAALAELAPERCADLVAERTADPDSRVRFALCAAAKKVLSRSFVPVLLRLLRDPEDSVRTHAKDALQAIEFYEQQTGHWKRLLSASGLDATSAAEALIRKARSGDREIRLAAIASLGTLGVAETLPFLLELMGNSDPAIAAAAKAAVEKINH